MTSEQVEAFDSPRFDINNDADAREMLIFLEENGYAVVASVATTDQIQTAKTKFWDYFEKINPLICRNDPDTWITKRWLADVDTGICNRHGFNHSDFLWDARLYPGVKKAFFLLWGTDRLIVSFDAGNVYRPWQHDSSWSTKGGWWHLDQNSEKGKDREGKVCIQGLVTYYDCTAESGGLCLIPGSHKDHAEVCARSPFAKLKVDFVQLEKNDPIIGRRKILVTAKAGDLILWDSRTVHCNTPGLSAGNALLNPPEKPGNESVPAEQLTSRSGDDDSTRQKEGEGVAVEALTTAAAVDTAIASSSIIAAGAAAGRVEPSRDGDVTSPEDQKAAAIEEEAIAMPTAAAYPSPISDTVEAPSAARALPCDSIDLSTDAAAGRLVPAAGGRCTRAGSVDIIRLVAYVCMLPRRLASGDCLDRRKTAFVNRVPSSHWPTQKIEVECFAEADDPQDPSRCSAEQLSLIGYSDWEISRLRKQRHNCSVM